MDLILYQIDKGYSIKIKTAFKTERIEGRERGATGEGIKLECVPKGIQSVGFSC